jgi:aerotaxis receptor
MKTNAQATQRELEYAEDAVFITKTDAQGTITFANDAFVAMSGFSREELLGAGHNIMRHPDMPDWVFADMWKTIAGGYPWRGLIKNLCKNGDHYWSRATVVPMVDHGKSIGYLSLRKKPTREEVASAEALYRQRSAPMSAQSLVARFRNLSLQTKVQVLIQPILLVLLGIANFSIAGHIEATLIESVKQRAEGIANEVIDSANLLMVTGQIGDVANRKLLINKISASGHITSLHLVRGDIVSRQYGPGLPEEQLSNERQREAIKNGQPYYGVEDRQGTPVFRAVTPTIMSHNFHGTDCLLCHQGSEGSANGASDIEIDMSADYASYRRIMTALALGQVGLQLLFFFFAGWVMRRFVARPVEEIKEHLSDLVNGNMQRAVDISRRDELGNVLCSVQTTKVLLGSIIDQITSVSNHINGRAKELTQAMAQVANGSEVQRQAAESMAAAVTQMSASVDQVAANSDEVRRVSEMSKGLADDGSKVVTQVVGDMARISSAVSQAAQAIGDLGRHSERIQSIVGSIKEIADQTNLLALNAAIEAARAGEQGRGFAVVADEVRSLAEKTQKSTQQVGEMTDAIRSSTGSAVREMDTVVSMVKSGSQLAQSAGGAIVGINDGASKVLHGVEDIAGAVAEQSRTSRGIADNVEKVAAMSQENGDAVRNVAATVDNLDKLAAELQQSVEHFRI